MSEMRKIKVRFKKTEARADADKWITVHPHSGKGTPALIGEDGTVKAGMGGKFNGKHISQAKNEGNSNQKSQSGQENGKLSNSEGKNTPKKVEAVKRGDLTITVNEDGSVSVMKGIDAIDLPFGEKISSVEELEASGSKSNKDLAKVVRDRGLTHIMGGRVALNSAEAAAIKEAKNNNPNVIKKREAMAKSVKENMERDNEIRDIKRGYKNQGDAAKDKENIDRVVAAIMRGD